MKIHHHRKLVLCALLAAAGCGSSGAKSGNENDAAAREAGIDTPVVSCGDPNVAIDPTAMIDDMEAPDSATLRIGGRTGGWWAGGDAMSTGAEILPNGDAPAEAIPGGRCGSRSAMRVTGHGFTAWAVLTVSMGYGSVDGSAPGLLPYDASARDGITFWARVGDTSANQMRLGISDKYTRPEGGLCVDAPGAGPDVACYDHSGVALSLETTWRQYKVPFAGLVQQGFGLREARLDTSSIITIEFNMPTGTTFDFWVDDIAFY